MNISLKSKLLISISSIQLYIGILILCFAFMNFFFSSNYRLDWGEIKQMNNENTEITTGNVTSSELESFYISGSQVSKTKYTFTGPDSLIYENFTHTDSTIRKDVAIEIEYVNSNPSINRIKGYKNSYYTSDVIGAIILAIVSIIVIIYSLLKSHKSIKSFKKSYFTYADPIKKIRYQKKGDPASTFKNKDDEKYADIVTNNKELIKGAKTQLIFVDEEKSNAVSRMFKGLRVSLENDYNKSINTKAS